MGMLQDLLLGLVVLSALILGFAGLVKVRATGTFGSQIQAYGILPLGMSKAAGIVLPFVEVAVASILLVAPGLGGWLAAILFITFAVAIAINLIRGNKDLVCGCFGAVGHRTLSWSHAGGNTLLALICVAATSGPAPGASHLFLGGTLLLLLIAMDTGRNLHAVGLTSAVVRGEEV
jgi:hypothetical protein